MTEQEQIAINIAFQEALCGPEVGNEKTEAERLHAIALVLSPFQDEIG